MLIYSIGKGFKMEKSLWAVFSAVGPALQCSDPSPHMSRPASPFTSCLSAPFSPKSSPVSRPRVLASQIPVVEPATRRVLTPPWSSSQRSGQLPRPPQSSSRRRGRLPRPPRSSCQRHGGLPPPREPPGTAVAHQ
jgi:hypothetical protein